MVTVKAYPIASDQLLFDEAEHGPSNDLLLLFEAASRVDDDERRVLH